jgi:hypothetical protein
MDLDQLVHGHVANRGRRRQPHHGSDSLGPHGGGAGGSSSAPTVPVAPPPPLVPHHHQHHGHHAGPPPPPPPLASWSGAGASSASAPARSKHPAASVPPPPQLPPPPPPPPPARSTSGIPSSSPSHMLPHAGPSASGPSASQGLVCDLCDRAFDSKATYDSHNAVFHRRSKTPAKPRPPAFTCPQCGKGSSPAPGLAHRFETGHTSARRVRVADKRERAANGLHALCQGSPLRRRSTSTLRQRTCGFDRSRYVARGVRGICAAPRWARAQLSHVLGQLTAGSFVHFCLWNVGCTPRGAVRPLPQVVRVQGYGRRLTKRCPARWRRRKIAVR